MIMTPIEKLEYEEHMLLIKERKEKLREMRLEEIDITQGCFGIICKGLDLYKLELVSITGLKKSVNYLLLFFFIKILLKFIKIFKIQGKFASNMYRLRDNIYYISVDRDVTPNFLLYDFHKLHKSKKSRF